MTWPLSHQYLNSTLGQALSSSPWIWTPTQSLLLVPPTQRFLRNALPAPLYLLGFSLLQASLTTPSPKTWAHLTVKPTSCPLDLLGSTQLGSLLQFPHFIRQGLDPREAGEMRGGPAMSVIHCAATSKCLKLSGLNLLSSNELRERTLALV